MTTTLKAPPATRRRQPLLVCALVAAGVVAGCLLFEHYWVQHAIPEISRTMDLPLDVSLFLAVVVPYAVFALVLAFWGIDARHRVAGAACAVGAGLAEWGLAELLQRYVFEHDHMTQRILHVYDWTVTLVIPTLLALAWGLARRRGRVWVLGVAVAPLLAALHHELFTHARWWQNWEFRHGGWWTLRLEFLAPVVAAAAVCWLLDVASRRTTPSEMGSSA